MERKEAFKQMIAEGYEFEGPSIILGGAMLEKACEPEQLVKLPLRTMNRHGLIAGATGSGKTKTLQILSEQLSAEGVPVLLMDIKGDLSGIAAPSGGHPKIDERHEKIGIPFTAGNSPVEFLSLSDEKGARLRATVTEFGPVLFSKILDLNETQSGIVAVIFKYCDDNQLPLLDLKDFRKTLQYLTKEGKAETEEYYGRIHPASVGSIQRKLIEIEQQGAEAFFGERSFEVADLCRKDEEGKGIVSILRLTDIQDKPKLFSTFMLQLMAEIYASFPEEGDLDRPKLVLFIDEAHLVFEEASKALLNQIESVIKLIRSKGVGIYFCTQNPKDIPDDVLAQLGLKIQHALRAFTAKDRKAIKAASENYPDSEYYKVSSLVTELGIGEALVTALNEKGIPTPLAHTLLRAPQSRMDILTNNEIKHLISQSEIIQKYNEEIDNESAYEILTEKIKEAQAEEQQEKLKSQRSKAKRGRKKEEKSLFEEVADSSVGRQIGRTVARELTRGLLGVLGIGGKGKKSSWF